MEALDGLRALDGLPQGTATTTAPANPPIPAIPAAPGAPTGGVQRVVIVDGQQQVPVVAGQGPGGTIATTGQPPEMPVDPEAIVRAALDGALPIFGILLSMVAFLTVGWPLARAFARRLDKRAEIGMVKASDVMPQIRQLQESVDAMAVELERISEAQRFQAKLMAERSPVLPPHDAPQA
jgi:hypothetical protein